MSDDGVPSHTVGVGAGGRWRVRQIRQAGGVLSRVEGPDGQHYAPHIVQAMHVADVRRLHEALAEFSPAPESIQRRTRLLDLLADAAARPTGLEEL